MKFDLSALKNNLLAATDDERGHDVSVALVLGQLVQQDEIKQLFAEKGVDVTRMEKMLQLEVKQKHAKKLRDLDVHSDNHDEGQFEAQKGQKIRSHHQSEKVHELINGIELAFLGNEITAADVLKQTLKNAPLLAAEANNPAQMLVQALAGQNIMESAGVETFKALEFNPLDLFPELKEKSDQKSQNTLDEAAQKVGKFIASTLAEVQKSPGAANAIEGILKGGPKSQGRGVE